MNGLDVNPLRPYVAALEDPGLPLAEARWLNSHQLQISTVITPGQIISVQISYASGWHARANGRAAPAHADALGLTVIQPGCSGPCTIDLTYDGGAEARWTRVAQWIGMPARFMAEVSGHSTQVGAAQDLAELDIDLAAITQAGGWVLVHLGISGHFVSCRYRILNALITANAVF